MSTYYIFKSAWGKNMLSKISDEAIEKIKGINLIEYEKPKFKLSKVAELAAIDASLVDIQNWTKRGFLTPAQSAPRKTKLYSLYNVVQASVIGHIVQSNTFSVAASIALAIANRGKNLIAEGYDFLANFEANTMGFYYYTVQGEQERGIFVDNQELSKIILGEKTVSGIVGVEKRFLPCDELIFDVFLNYVNQK